MPADQADKHWNTRNPYRTQPLISAQDNDSSEEGPSRRNNDQDHYTTCGQYNGRLYTLLMSPEDPDEHCFCSASNPHICCNTIEDYLAWKNGEVDFLKQNHNCLRMPEKLQGNRGSESPELESESEAELEPELEPEQEPESQPEQAQARPPSDDAVSHMSVPIVSTRTSRFVEDLPEMQDRFNASGNNNNNVSEHERINSYHARDSPRNMHRVRVNANSHEDEMLETIALTDPVDDLISREYDTVEEFAPDDSSSINFDVNSGDEASAEADPPARRGSPRLMEYVWAALNRGPWDIRGAARRRGYTLP